MIQRTLNILFAALILGLCGMLVSMSCSEQKTGYIEIGKVYNEFQYKKELEAQLQNTQQARKLILDSLELELKSMSKSLDAGKPSQKHIDTFESKKHQYLEKRQLFEKDNQNQVAQYMEEIMQLINQYVKEYGTAEGYTYIYGAEGSGTLMYAKEQSSITEKVIEYINKKYKQVK
jgi:outer membrane protein